MQIKRERVNFGHDIIYAMDITFTLDELHCIVLSLETEYKNHDKSNQSYKTRVKKLHDKLNLILFNDDINLDEEE